MIPFLESAGGNCQNSVILVEDFARRESLAGAFEGAAVEQLLIKSNISKFIYPQFKNSNLIHFHASWKIKVTFALFVNVGIENADLMFVVPKGSRAIWVFEKAADKNNIGEVGVYSCVHDG